MSTTRGKRSEGPDATGRPDRPGGRERILAAAMAILEAHGEAGLRLADVAERAEVAISAITHHFATREGLLAELHADRYAGLTRDDLAAARTLAQSARSREELAAGLAALTDAILDTARDRVRLARIVSIGATHGRPELRGVIRHTATELIDGLEMAIITAQARGLIDRKVDARVFATFIHAYAVGMVVTDLDENPVPRDALARFIDRANAWTLTDPED
jgi:AcrR family transcriptional regulator